MPYINVLWMGDKHGQHAFVTVDRIDAIVALACVYAMGGADIPLAIKHATAEASAAAMLDVFVDGGVYGLVTASTALVDRVREALNESGVAEESDESEEPATCPWCEELLDREEELTNCSICGQRICSLCAVEYVGGGMLCDLCWHNMYNTTDGEGEEANAAAPTASDVTKQAAQARLPE